MSLPTITKPQLIEKLVQALLPEQTEVYKKFTERPEKFSRNTHYGVLKNLQQAVGSKFEDAVDDIHPGAWEDIVDTILNQLWGERIRKSTVNLASIL